MRKKKTMSENLKRFLETVCKDEVLAHNPECAICEHALQCLAGCRASALEFHPTDILAPDPAACVLFKGGWVEKIRAVMTHIRPEAHARI